MTEKNERPFHGDQVEGTRLASLQNKINTRNKSGVKGVSYDPVKDRWIAQMHLKGKCVLAKGFKTKDEAIAARKAAEEKYVTPILEKYPDFKKTSFEEC